MKGIYKYRCIYAVIGVVFAFIITQSSLDDRTQRWVLVTYIVLGIIVAEYIGRKILKKKVNAKTDHK
ncbi:hypothetical protein ABE021_13555 [Sporosarcina gallistercoris]|uniref:hypothetical protein n=1 Tax=Sporosarcina gallistercoris TaxID=2762245 RepID=UPI003D2D95B5